MASKHAASLWSEIPSELLGLVLRRLDSFADRVRVAVVCQPWRSGARLQYHQLPPPMPWIALGDEAYVDTVNNTVHRLNLTVPHDADCHGSVDNLLFLTRSSGGCFLADPFSGAVLPVVDLAFFLKQQTRKEMLSLHYSSSLSIKKVVVHWPQGSAAAEPLVAALIADKRDKYRNTVFVCRAGTGTGVGKKSYGAMSVNLSSVLDMAFFCGKIYALSTCGQLLAVEIHLLGSSGNPVITNVKKLDTIGSPRARYNDVVDDDNDDDYEIVDFIGYEEEAYLVESGDQLLKLNRWATNSAGETERFTVYEADLGASPFKWKLVRSLRGRALFVGRYGSNSKSVPVGDGHCSAQQDCIYFVRHSGDSGIYNVESRKMMGPLVSDNEVPQRLHRRPWIPTWVFPDQSAIQKHNLKMSLA